MSIVRGFLKWFLGDNLPLSTKRMGVCVRCDEYRDSPPRCNACGCFLKAKTRDETEHCPLNKWEK